MAIAHARAYHYFSVTRRQKKRAGHLLRILLRLCSVRKLDGGPLKNFSETKEGSKVAVTVCATEPLAALPATAAMASAVHFAICFIALSFRAGARRVL